MGRPYPTRGGTGHFRPLIRPAGADPKLLSFTNLIEAHVLRALRTEHGVAIKALRVALRYAERALGIERLLLSRELCTSAGELFLDRYGELIQLSKSGQLAMRRILEAHLERVEWDTASIPRRLYPFVQGESGNAPRLIAIDPTLAFGRPVVLSKAISTSVIVGRLDAGESVPELADDYGIAEHEVEEAVLYERAA